MDFILRLMPPCILHHFTGFYCPGCGGTRAFVALIHGQFLKSFYYHPLVFYVAVCLTWYALKQGLEIASSEKISIPMPKIEVLSYIAAIIVGTNFVIRNILYLVWGITIY